MRLYYEATENLPVDSPEEPEFIRADITDKTDAERVVILQTIKDVMAGLDYRLIEHSCSHDEGGACQTKEIQI